MTDLEIISLIGTRLEEAIAANWPSSGLEVVQKNPSRQAGIPDSGGVFIEKLFDQHYGFPMQEMVYDPARDVYDEIERQWLNTHVQVSVIYPQDPLFPGRPTASDAANVCKLYLSARNTIRAFAAVKVGISRITEVRNPYFQNDRDQYEAHPGFDIVLSHIRSIKFDVPAVHEIIPSGDPYPLAPGPGIFRV